MQHFTDAHAGEGDNPAGRKRSARLRGVSARDEYVLRTAGEHFGYKDGHCFFLLLHAQLSSLDKRSAFGDGEAEREV